MNTQIQMPTATGTAGLFSNLLAFLNRLQDAHIPYSIRHSRSDAVMVRVVVPGERWEIDFLEDGEVDVEVFRSSEGVVAADGLLDHLINTYRSDTE